MRGETCAIGAIDDAPPQVRCWSIEARTCYKAIARAHAKQRGEAESNLSRAVTLQAGITATISVR